MYAERRQTSAPGASLDPLRDGGNLDKSLPEFMESAGGVLPLRKRFRTATTLDCDHPAATIDSPALGGISPTSTATGAVVSSSSGTVASARNPDDQPTSTAGNEHRGAAPGGVEAVIP